MGIVEKVRNEPSRSKAFKLVKEAREWKYISPKTLRKIARLAKQKPKK